MGLAASQARLLSITQRISDNELRAQLINNQKMRLNSESSKVSENYINALNKTNLVFANYDSEDKAQNVPLTFKNLTAFNQYNNQYNLTNTAGNVLISEDDAEKYKASGGNLEKFLQEYDIEYTTSYWDTITDQLHKCEAFYTTPNQTGIVENLRYDNTKQNWTSDIDGDYAFFTAEQLRKMYEGGNGTSKYEDTIKTSEYADFVKYYDLFYDKLSKYNKETKKRNALIENLASNLQEKTGDLINASQITVNSNGTLSTTATKNLSTYFDGASTINLNDYVKNITASSLGFTEFGGKWTKDQNWQDILDVSINKTTHKGTTPKVNALYFDNTNDGNLYVQIMGAADLDDNGANETSYWLNTSNNKIYSYNGSSFNELPDNDSSTAGYQQTMTDETGATITYTTSATWDNTNKIASWTESDGSNSETTIVKYPDDTNADYRAPKFELDFTNTEHKKIVQDLAASYVNNMLYAEIIKDLLEGGATVKTGTGILSDEEIGIINTPVTSGTELTTVVDELERLLGVDIGNDTDKMMGILDALSTGINLVESVDAAGNIIYTIPTVTMPGGNTVVKLTGKPVDLANALVCDTMMDYFGEPVYGYMKKNANDEWIVADEEARWYTNLFNKIKSCGFQVLADGLANSTDWMQFALENGIVIMEQINSEQNWQPITHTSCSDVIEQTDTQAATLAEAEYNKAMRQIEAKDEMFDLELKNIDTEHASLESEYESVKKAMTGNIERTFQMYG